ncbi:MAG: hypothetical protein FD180_766 [Planctomycetota bacterium]|nr:MAG: hypothetical protein FD180_766 [Planctomycetota bacterium]
MFRVAALAGISLVAGTAIGVALRQAENSASRPTASATAPADGVSRGADGAELVSLRARAEELRGQLAGQIAGTAAVRAVDAASLRLRRDEWTAKKDGDNLFALIHECLLAGPEGYALALETAALLWDYDADFKFTWAILGRLTKGGLQPAVTWALEHFQGLPANSLGLAIRCAGEYPEDHGPGAHRLLLTIADTCPDGELASQAASHLGHAPPELDPELDAYLRRHAADSKSISAALDALVSHRYAGLDAILRDLVATQHDNEATLLLIVPRMGDGAADILVSLSSDPLPRVAEKARFQLIRLKPPVPGLLVEQAAWRKEAAPRVLRRGDIVTACNGKALVAPGDLREGVRPGDSARRVTVRRGDETLELEVEAEEILGSSTSATRRAK